MRNIKKKSFLAMAVLMAMAAGVVGMSAFEAHVINVTAKIENALGVSTKSIEFGTVFPQEELSQAFDVFLSQSFYDEDRVDDVGYVIKEKPKVRFDEDQDGTPDPYADLPGELGVAHEYCLNNKPEDAGDPNDPYYIYCYPNLCGMLEETPSDEPAEEEDGIPGQDGVVGYLSKIAGDISDSWLANLTVSGFEGMVDQAYTENEYGPVIDPRLEHETFGCDLWVEVTSVSRLGNSLLVLENKDPSDWTVINDETKGTLVYNSPGSTFDYTLKVQGLKTSTNYSLIYYRDCPESEDCQADGWPGKQSVQIATFTTDSSGNATEVGAVDLATDLPKAGDKNAPGAKIWVVLTSDWGSGQMSGWHPSDYLFETELITYDDTDV